MTTAGATSSNGGGSGGASSSAAGSPPPPTPHEIALAKSLRSHSATLRRAFLDLDVDRDGYVTRSDLRAALHNSLGVDLSREQMDAIFVRFAYFEDDHRNGVMDEEEEEDGGGGAGEGTAEGGGSAPRKASGVHHGIKYAEFVRYLDSTLLDASAASASRSYGSTLALASAPSEPHSPRPQMMLIKPPPDVTTKQLRQTLARVMRQRTKSGGARGGKGGKKAQLFLEMDTDRSGRITVGEFREWASSHGLELDDGQARMALGEHYHPEEGIDFREFSRGIEEMDDGGGAGGAMPWEAEDDFYAARRKAGLEAGAKAQVEADEIARRRMSDALRACVDDAMSDRELVSGLSEKLWTRRTRLVDAFKKFDVDKDGKLTAGELRAALGEAGMVVSEDRAESLVGKFDRDGDGRLNRGDFVRLISSGGSSDEGGDDGGDGTEEKKAARAAASSAASPSAPPPQAPAKPPPPAPAHSRRASGDQQRAALLSSLKGHEDEKKAADIVDKLDDDDVAAIMSFREALDAERVMMRKVFQDMDRDGTKDLDAKELREGFERLRLEVSDEHIRHIMRRFDPQNTGRLRYYQFVKLLSANLDDH